MHQAPTASLQLGLIVKGVGMFPGLVYALSSEVSIFPPDFSPVAVLTLKYLKNTLGAPALGALAQGIIWPVTSGFSRQR